MNKLKIGSVIKLKNGVNVVIQTQQNLYERCAFECYFRIDLPSGKVTCNKNKFNYLCDNKNSCLRLIGINACFKEIKGGI